MKRINLHLLLFLFSKKIICPDCYWMVTMTFSVQHGVFCYIPKLTQCTKCISWVILLGLNPDLLHPKCIFPLLNLEMANTEMKVTGHYESREACRKLIDLPDSAACCCHACSLFLSNQPLSLLYIIGDPLASHLWAPPSPPPRKCDWFHLNKSLTKQRKINRDRCHYRPPFISTYVQRTSLLYLIEGGRPKII